MRTPLTPPAKAYLSDAYRAEPEASAQSPEGLVRWLALLILLLLEPWNAVRLFRARRRTFLWQDLRPDLPAGSTQSEAASIRGPFGNAIAWMCRRNGVGPGHPEWPELSRAIVAFGGSVAGFRAGMPPSGALCWENPNIVPGIVTGFGVPVATASLLQQAVANALPSAPHAMQAVAAHARLPASKLPASWLSASGRQVFARAGPSPSTGPPGCPGLPNLSCLNARGRSTAGPAVLIRAD
jgi:hypothetical protein